MKMRQLFIATLVLSSSGAMLALNSGCILAAAGAAGGAVAYVEGKFTAHLNNPYDRVVRATERAIPQLQFAQLSEKHDALKAEFLARTADDTKITVEITRESDNLAQVEIRVGTFGDKQVSMTIFDKIKDNL
jgi:hypothetical protein